MSPVPTARVPMRALSASLTAAALLAAGGVESAQAVSVPTAPSALSAASTFADGQSAGTDSKGNTTVAWRTYPDSYLSPTETRVSAKRVSGTGRAGGNWTLFTEAGRTVRDVVSATTPSGVTTVAWAVNDLIGNGARILARRISAKGALGATIRIAPEGTSVSHLRVASSANAGTSTVVWSTDNGGDSAVIKSVRVSGAGAGGTEIPLTGPTESAYDPTIAAASDGTFTVAWRKSIGAVDSAQVRRIAPSGKLGTTRTLGSSSLTTTGDVALATAANGLTSILWTEVGETSNVIRFSQVDSRGRYASPRSVSSRLLPEQPAVGVTADGTTFVSWLILTEESFGVRATRVTPKGTVEPSVAVSPADWPVVPQGPPALSVGPAGGVTIAWTRISLGARVEAVQVVRLDSRRRASRIHGLPASRSGNLQGSRGAVLSAGATGPTRIVFQRRNNGSEGPSLQISSWK